ncbi:bifunctional pyrazinamidase/nicotinamidase [Desulfosarcina ovata subsp. sediminis]|uniref:Bifunctional pyrazinamidase/nicotinamidase n=1 Tax=Desulfosarcina ovata subsp. sediminis TaxID=885957 RepID=A0A5K7ZJC4_9BACT|nr:isochorismatase family cysteine hydrolase [Desulfosarcina ovata]BBO80981.1 bifunctional pyrazinamidase/nicotinamidase [Desulfosarcina ovata subsp. sediminis]
MKKYAIVVVDMLKDTFKKRESTLAAEGLAIVPTLNRLLQRGRELNFPVIFAMDSFFREDYFFNGRIKPFSIRGTSGATVLDEIDQRPEDIYLPKRRWSAFFKTDLDQILRVKHIDVVILCGVTTGVCVLATALDALSHDFEAILLEDCSAALNPEEHRAVVDVYRKSGLYPYLRVSTSDALWDEIDM